MKKNDTKKSEPKTPAQVAVGAALIPTGPSMPAQVFEHDEKSVELFGKIELKKGETFSRQDAIDQLQQQINSQFKGSVVIRQGSQITNVFMLRRPTGITNLDLAIGGGIPAGGLTQVIGKFSAGKTYLVNRIMAEVQRIYGNEFAASVNMTEQRYDKHFAKWLCGLRIALSDGEIAVLRQGYRENGQPDFEFTADQLVWLKDQVGYFLESVGSTAEQILEATVQQVESNLFQIVLVDSFGALLTKAEAEAEEGLEQKHRGGAAMVITQFMHRLHAALNMPDKYGRPNTTSVIGINQYRDNVNAGLYGNPMKQAGGNALAHGQLLNIELEQGAKIRHAVGKEHKIIGKMINWGILKAKAGAHDGPKGEYKLYTGEMGIPFGVDIYSDLLSAGLQAGVVQLKGAWYSYQGENIGQGEQGAAQVLYQNPDMIQSIRREIFKAAGLKFIVRENV